MSWIKALAGRGNQLTALYTSNIDAIESIDCSRNKLTTLDFSDNINLKFLSCENNMVRNLNLTNNWLLETLICHGNQLLSLDVSNNSALSNIHLEDMTTLSQVCVWEMPFPPDGVYIDTTNSSNVFFTLDCY